MVKRVCAVVIVTIFFLSPGFGNLCAAGKIDLQQWVMTKKEAEIVQYKGKEALRLKTGKGSAIAYLKDVEFTDGTIELDIAAIPRFTGLVFRVQNERIYEGIYFRPQNSRHKDPGKRAHTVQYISHPRHTWYYLRGKYPGKYEAAVDIPPGEWFHVKVTVSGTEAAVYVNKAKTPCLVVKDLKHGSSKGSVGVWCGNSSGGTFADFTVKSKKPSSPPAAEVSYSNEQNYLFDIFKTRRSVRKFKSTPIPAEHLLKILDIARSAPTSGNQQPWKFLVIQDREKLDQLKEECLSAAVERIKSRGNVDAERLEAVRQRYKQNFENYLSAPVYVSVLVDSNSRYPSYNTLDGSLAAGYLIIAARALGYGTVFITDAIPFTHIKKVFKIPDNFQQICITPIGVPEEWPQSPKKKSLEEFLVFETFVKGINYTLPVKRTAIKLDPKIFDDYVGKYELNPNFVITVTKEDGRLYTQATGQAKIEVFPEAKTKFFLKVADIQLTFVKDKEGKVTQLIIHQGGRDTALKKIE